MSKNPVADYNAQNGVTETGGPDPAVIAMISQAAAQTGADPVALLATSLEESGARRGRVGDAGTSFGPFQFHIGGALGNHTPQWANTFPAVLNRAQEFSRLGVHGGPGAAAVQRPADRQLYAEGVNSLLAKARALLHEPPAAPAHTGGPLNFDHGLAPPGAGGPLSSLAPTARLAAVNAIMGGNTSALASLVQRAGGTGASPPAAHSAVSSPGGGAQPLGTAGKVITGPAKIIGTPYHGSHTLFGNWESDNAIDIALPRGTPIYAPTGGTIGSQIGALNSHDPHLEGLRVHLDSPNQSFYFAHLSRIIVKPGERVNPGQLIGYSGEANGVQHLHLGVLNGHPQAYA